ncbi:hypothetical protein [Chitinivibrio alkaliphilus]|uniref:Deoxynucleoside monophosphate kinase n=1 Tax=Chitinivibrio alkaliphilus ACht1 TaxID=1313304 RepID=U7DA65_9BACT|nr:hypothetical protein [Chitinivibrio alkaliphilus]ERP39279.1 hypothetical protein CALK_0071 [Chitinivibrio alkaliphilus ACht1]
MKKQIILLAGKINSGKNHAGSFLEQRYINQGIPTAHLFFAKRLKDLCCHTFERYSTYLQNELTKIVSRSDDPVIREIAENLMIHQKNWYEEKNDSTRLILQDVGTRLVRDAMDADFWPRQIIPAITAGKEEVYIITDFRFPNEYQVLKTELGKTCTIHTIRIEREIPEKEHISNHPSEDSLGTFPFDFTVNNRGSLADFERALDELFYKLQRS